MTLVPGARFVGQRERCGQKNCKTPALSVVVHVCRYVDVLYTHACAVTECSFVCTFGSIYRVPETNCVHPFTSSLFSQQQQHSKQCSSDILQSERTTSPFPAQLQAHFISSGTRSEQVYLDTVSCMMRTCSPNRKGTKGHAQGQSELCVPLRRKDS